jgi:hypothetical protein
VVLNHHSVCILVQKKHRKELLHLGTCDEINKLLTPLEEIDANLTTNS